MYVFFSSCRFMSIRCDLGIIRRLAGTHLVLQYLIHIIQIFLPDHDVRLVH